MDIVFVTSEVEPFAKTGGLADVCGALPAALSRLGHRVTVFAPSYRQVEQSGLPLEKIDMSYDVPVGDKMVWGGLLRGQLPDSDVPVYFLKHDHYFHRDGLYNSGGVDYQDNCERFVFFCRGVFRVIERLGLKVDVLHANDWQTGLVPAYLSIFLQNDRTPQDPSELFETRLYPPSEAGEADKVVSERWKNTRSVFTIHNMRYQGRFWHQEMNLTGIDWRYFTFDRMEFYGQLNLLKTGITFADAVTTVSPRYAQEIQTEQFGERLQGVLRYRSDTVFGILNGIDTESWNPETDPALPAHFNKETVFEGKPICKAALQEELGLEKAPDRPLFGIVSRFDPQKGLDQVADIIPRWVESVGAQFAVLGTGDHDLEERYRWLSSRYPNQVSAQIRFGAPLSRRIEAGSDLFLMPSRYEPCGLNQMYSQRYGTLPLVRETGGLADTVVGANEETLQAKTADGFSFQGEYSDDLNRAIETATGFYYHRKDDWRQMVETAMNRDHSWQRSAQSYEDLYRTLWRE